MIRNVKLSVTFHMLVRPYNKHLRNHYFVLNLLATLEIVIFKCFLKILLKTVLRTLKVLSFKPFKSDLFHAHGGEPV